VTEISKTEIDTADLCSIYSSKKNGKRWHATEIFNPHSLSMPIKGQPSIPSPWCPIHFHSLAHF